MVQSSAFPILYINPDRGNDNGNGSQASPYRTITRAVRQATRGTTLRLTSGTYSVASGEVFPLVIPVGVIVLGDETSKGNGFLIEGSGEYLSPTFNRQNITLRLENDAELRGVTVSNRVSRGTGVWLESTNPTIANSTFVSCGREGIFATGNALPDISDNRFQNNTASGISMARNAKGVVQRNICQNTGYGIAISDNAAPLISANQVISNQAGIVISGTARPVLRNNHIEQNSGDGLIVMNNAVPDLGRNQDPGGNVIQGNTGLDLRNSTPTALLSVGNSINPTRVNGPVNFVASEIQPVPVPTPTPVPIPAPVPTPSPIPAGADLADIVGHWAEPFIRSLVDRGLLSGFPDRTFRPEQYVTRVQYAAAIAKAFNFPARRQSSGFTDIQPNFWAAAAIAKAEQMGFIAGFPDRTFRPNQNLTRIQAIVSLVSGLGLAGGNPNSLDVYMDRAQIPSYAVNAVAIATQKRIVVNHPQSNWLEPMVDITRAEMAAMIYQSLVAIGQASAIGSQFIIQPNFFAASFSDIQGHWAIAFIRGLASQGFISGFADGTFRPNVEMTRAQYAAVLVSTFNPQPIRPAIAFSDVPANFWAAEVIQRAYRGGLLSGVSNNQFQPNQSILRVQVLVSLANGLKLPAADSGLLNLYDDADAIPAYAKDAIARATAQRIVLNYPNLRQLIPNGFATRGEVAAMVYRATVYLRRSPDIDSSYTVEPTP
ncbi:MAG TPA: S-layer homology domain-containing protein, partial [Crinalium sp.]